MPVPCQSSSSRCTRARMSVGSAEGPAEKLKERLPGRASFVTMREDSLASKTKSSARGARATTPEAVATDANPLPRQRARHLEARGVPRGQGTGERREADGRRGDARHGRGRERERDVPQFDRERALGPAPA